jgi:hypothetical protein
MSPDLHTPHQRRNIGLRRLLIVAAVAAAMLTTAAPAHASDVGTADFTYGTVSAPTGQKPQSKLWFADGIWWGSLYNSTAKQFRIHRFDWSANTWSDTGVLVDPRASASMDALWDGDHLYIASAGKSPTDTASSPEIRRYSYDPASQTWSADAGYPVRISNGGVEAVVMAKDSRGVLWATFTLGSRVYVTHSDGRDDAWVQRYELPTPSGESQVDPDDISAIVAYDGTRVGVLWSNQRTQKMYWSSHADGDNDQAWALDIAYDRPEGADDHINLKSLQADSAGRVFAAVKTSLNSANDPLINLLVLGLDGTWSVHTIGTVADQLTRAIVLIDETNRDLYVFASAPCCSGGVIYYKKTSLDHPQFETGLGTPFIASAANPKINNPTSTKQNLNSTTGLLVLAGDDSTRRYLHHAIALPKPLPDTTPPDTVLTDQPPSVTTDHTATFGFSSTEAGSTYACSLDGAEPAPCGSPVGYGSLATGSHTFTVAATDSAGNTDPTPASATWEIQDPSQVLFSDDFSSGGFAAGGWVVGTAGGGTATVASGAVHPGDPGARLVSTTAVGSYAYLRHNFDTAPSAMTVSWTAMVASQTTSAQTFSLLRVYDTAGMKVMNVDRDGPTGQLVIWHSGQTVSTGTVIPLSIVAAVTVQLKHQAGGDLVAVSVDGTEIYRSTTASLGSGAISRFLVGENSARRAYDYRADDLLVTA